MDKESLIKLTAELYKLTLLFPKKEPMRYKMRELADDILAKLILVCNNDSLGFHERYFSELEKDLEILDSFFEVARNQNWTSPYEVLKLKEEYDKIQQEFKKISETEKLKIKEEIPQKKFKIDNRPARQKKILEILQEKEKVQVWEIKNVFPKVTKRTLRRDFEQLLKEGLVERIGQRNETFYRLKPNID